MAKHTQSALTREMMAGGFSYRITTGRSPRSGFMVSIYESEGVTLPIEDYAKTRTVSKFVKQHNALLQRSGHYLGGWTQTDASGKEVGCLDISVRRSRLEDAILEAEAHRQQAVYDVRNGLKGEDGTIYVADYRKKHPKAPPTGSVQAEG